jgi:hypothetical protein
MLAIRRTERSGPRSYAEGKGLRTPPHERRSYWCEKSLHFSVDGRAAVKECCLRDDGRHRTLDGATWEHGVEDCVPAPAWATIDLRARPASSARPMEALGR